MIEAGGKSELVGERKREREEKGGEGGRKRGGGEGEKGCERY